MKELTTAFPEYEAVELLKNSGMRLALAESCTGGLIAKRITDVPGASEVFECGIVSYSDRIKQELLSVEEEMLRVYGAVSAPVACEMALGALKNSGADIAVGVTGIAGPGSDGTNKPVGLVYIAVCDRESRVRVTQLRIKTDENDVRTYNRNYTADFALRSVADYFKSYPALPEYERADEFLKKYR